MPHICPLTIPEALGSSITTSCLIKYQKLGGINPTQRGLEACPGSDRVIQQSKELNQNLGVPYNFLGPKAFPTPLVKLETHKTEF